MTTATEAMTKAGTGTEAISTAGTGSSALYRDSIVCDMTLPWGSMWSDDEHLKRFKQAGLGLVSLTVGSDGQSGAGAIMTQIMSIYATCRRHPDLFALASSVDDIVNAKQAGKMALVMNIQGMNALGGDTGMIEIFYKLGVRTLLIAYNRKNLVGDGCAERTDCGLSRWGIQVIEEINRVGMILDGTHTGYTTTMEAMEMTRAPFIFSHSNAHAVFPHYRNIKDDQIKACAKTRGLIGVNGLGAFLYDYDAATGAMFRHLDYIANLVGPQHVGIGLDWLSDKDRFWKWVHTHPDTWPQIDGKPHPDTHFAQPEQLEELCEMMVRAGYATDDIRGVLGGNFLRVARQTWE